MKSLFGSIVLMFVSQIALAETQLQAAPLVLEIVRSVGFAPPHIAGQYKTVVFADGTVFSVNNKKISVEVLRLSDSAMTSLLKEIAVLEPAKLIAEGDGPGCFDAPSTSIVAHKADGANIVVAKTVACKDSILPTGYTMRHLANSLDNLATDLR